MKPARIRTLFRTSSARSMSIRRAWFAEVTPPEKTDTTPPAQPPATPPENSGGFTQADVDRIIADRLKRDREAQQAKLLESLGVTSLDDAKTALDAKRKADEAALSETQKLQAQIETANKKAAEFEQRAKDTEAKYINEQRRNVFEGAVTASGGNNARRVYALMQLEKPADFAAVFSEDATPDDGKLKALIKQVQSDYPEYFGSAGAGSPSNAGGMAPTVQKVTEDTKKEIEKKFGKL